jgi:hypothetical protein
MKNDKITLVISLAALISLILMLILGATLSAAEAVKVSIFGPLEVAPGSIFSIDIDIGPVTNLRSWRFDVNYDKNVIQMVGNEGGVGVINGQMDSKAVMTVTGWKFQPPGTPGNAIRVQGQVNSPVTGSGYLATISFKVLAAIGTKSNLTLSNVILNDNSGNIITSTVINGLVSVVANPKPPPTRSVMPAATQAATNTPTITSTSSVTPVASTNPQSSTPPSTQMTETVSPTFAVSGVKISVVVPQRVPAGANFVVRLDISGVANLDNYYLLFKYDPSVVDVTDVTSGLIASTTVPVEEWVFVPAETQGQVKIIGNTSGSKGVNGAGYLARIHCHMVGSVGDKSDLSVSNIGLLDMLANNIAPASVTNNTVTVIKGTPTSGSSSNLIFIIIGAVVGLAIIGGIVYYFFFWRKHRKKPSVRGPSPPADQGRRPPPRRPVVRTERVENPDQLLDVMRDRLSQLPSKRGGKPGQTKPPQRN